MLRKNNRLRQPCYTPRLVGSGGRRTPRSVDDDPGGYAKWVRRPHGPATVSGYASLGPRPVFSSGPATELRLGKACAADFTPRVRKPDPRGRPSVSARRTPEEPTLPIGQPRAAIS